MKLTLQFTNDNLNGLNPEIDVEIPKEVMAQLEAEAKRHNVPVDKVIEAYISYAFEEFKKSEMEYQEEIPIE